LPRRDVAFLQEPTLVGIDIFVKDYHNATDSLM
jgi:hypothetical protein